MPIVVTERFGSRRQSGGTWEFLYSAAGSDESDDVSDAIFAAAPDEYDGAEKSGVTDLDQQGNGLWFGTVSYPTGVVAVGGGAEATQSFEFDTSNGTQHIQNALSQEQCPVGPSQSDVGPDFGNAINVSGVGADMAVDGVDIGLKQFDFSITRKIPIEDFTADYIFKLYDLAWHYNKEDDLPITFRSGVTVTFPAGTILFKGARGGGQEGEQVSITYLFSYSPNIPDASSAGDCGDGTIDGIEVCAKLGWQYLWVYRMPEVVAESSGGKEWLVMKVKGIYIADVYCGADLTELNVA